MRFVQYHPRAASGDGGITNSVRRLAEAMATLGQTPLIVSDDDAPAPVLDGVTWRQVHHRHVAGQAIPADLRPVFAGTDVVVMNSAWTAANASAGRAARRVGVPYVLAPRGAYDPRIVERRRIAKRAWWWVGERDLVRRSRAVHVFFPSDTEALRRLGYRGDVIVAPNGVRVPDDTRWHGANGEILFIGRLDVEHKGLDLLVRAVAALPPGTLPVVRILGPDQRGGRAALTDLISSLGIQDRVIVGDAIYGQAKWDAIAGSRAFVYPSRWEGFGNAPAEAAAIGVPTLVTPYPLGSYLAGAGAAIVAPATVEGLAEGLQAIVSHEGARCGPIAADLVTREFTWEAVARAWLTQVEAWA